MKRSMFAVAATALIMLGSAHAGATGSQGSHNGKSTYNVKKNAASNSNKGGNIDNNKNKKSDSNNNTRTDGRAAARASSDANAGSDAVAGAESGGGSSSVSVEGDDAPASSAAPTYITTSDDTCMGSSSVGGQGDAFGFSVASAWTDSNCIMLKNARELKAQGHHKAARARLCMNEDNALAFELAGEPCPRALPSTQAALAKIRTIEPGYVATVQPSVQLAMLGEAAGGATSAAGGESGATPGGTLLAMVQSAAQQVAAAFTAAARADVAPEPYTLYGIE